MDSSWIFATSDLVVLAGFSVNLSAQERDKTSLDNQGSFLPRMAESQPINSDNIRVAGSRYHSATSLVFT